ncbi:hypothetical protein [Paludibacterium yongneupense]|uniref:hypothetical protein n=1 Tax=Paludibacterium yongneupense TaxID=400061 RepID=UPI000491B36B|nr:hypothetical protein [Paludibacterium yongneupense]
MDPKQQLDFVMADIGSRSDALKRQFAEFKRLQQEIERIMAARDQNALQCREKIEQALSGDFEQKKTDVMSRIAVLGGMVRALDSSLKAVANPGGAAAGPVVAPRKPRRRFV